MGLASFLNRKAHKELLKRAMEHSWASVNGISMVFGPLSIALESTQPSRSEVERHIDRWLIAWSELKSQIERNLGASGDEYGVWADTILTPILFEFDSRLETIRNNQELGGGEMIAEVVALNLNAPQGYLEFHTSLVTKGKEIGFDATKSEQKAIKKAHKFWEPTVRGLAGLTRFPD